MSRHSVAPGRIHAGKPLRKKFCTQGEEFFDFLKASGYHSPKHQTYQHFEHMFHEDKTANFARKLMSVVKPDNGLSLEESKKFEKLKENSVVLYGADLEEAVARRRAIDLMYSQQKDKIREKREKLSETVSEKDAKLERLKSVQDVFMLEFDKSQQKQDRINLILGVLRRWISEYEIDVDVDMKMLTRKMEELEKTIVELKKGLVLDSTDPQYLCQLDVGLILEKEEALMVLIQEMITKHGADLIMKDAGYAVEGDPWNEANIKKIFGQYEQDFERLKHCVIYEKAVQIQAEVSLAGVSGSLESFQDCYKSARGLSSMGYDAQAKFQMETRDKINDITTALDKESGVLLETVRDVTLNAFNQQFSSIVDIKSRAKKKVHEFFAVTMSTLKAQKIRMLLMRNLVKSEAKIYGKVMTNIEQNIEACTAYNKKLAQASSPIVGFTEEGKLLAIILSIFGITNVSNLMLSVPQLELTVRKCLGELDEAYWKQANEGKTKVAEGKKQVLKQTDVVKKLLRGDTEKESGKRSLDEEERNLKDRKKEFNRLQQTRPAKLHGQEQDRSELDKLMRKLIQENETF